MSKTAVLSTVIEKPIKDALVEFCRRQGLKIRHVVEKAILEQIEDEIDLEAFRKRRDEETVPLERILEAEGRKAK